MDTLCFMCNLEVSDEAIRLDDETVFHNEKCYQWYKEILLKISELSNTNPIFIDEE